MWSFKIKYVIVIIQILFILTCISSCDYYNNTRICNSTNESIDIFLGLNSEQLNGKLNLQPHNFENISFCDFLERTTSLEFIDFDSIKAIAHYELQADSCAQIEGGNSYKPNFRNFTSITIISKTDTIILRTKEEMIRAFNADTEERHYYYDFVVE